MRNNRYYENSQYPEESTSRAAQQARYTRTLRMDPPPRYPRQGRLVHHQGTVRRRAPDRPRRTYDRPFHLAHGQPEARCGFGCTYSKFANDDAQSDSEHSKFGDAKEDGTFDVEDLAMGFIRFDNGACLRSSSAGLPTSRARRDSSSFAEPRRESPGATTAMPRSTPRRTASFNTVRSGGMGNGHDEALRHSRESCLTAQLRLRSEQGLNMIKILEVIYKSAETGREVVLMYKTSTRVRSRGIFSQERADAIPLRIARHRSSVISAPRTRKAGLSVISRCGFCRAVLSGECDCAILVCEPQCGMSIAANKFWRDPRGVLLGYVQRTSPSAQRCERPLHGRVSSDRDLRSIWSTCSSIRRFKNSGNHPRRVALLARIEKTHR